MKKLLAAILALTLVFIPLTACGGGESSVPSSEVPASSIEASDSIPSDTLSTMSDEEYRNLNKTFDAFIIGGVKYIQSEADVLQACFIIAHLEFDSSEIENPEDNWFVIPKENVEKLAKKHFDVDSINHEKFNIKNPDGYRDGYYSNLAGYDLHFDTWHNVSSLTNNFDGTYTAEVYQYFTRGNKPNNNYDKESEWNLAPNQKIIDNNTHDYPVGDDEVSIFKQSVGTLVLKPYEGSWQIVKINDFAIPKKLLF